MTTTTKPNPDQREALNLAMEAAGFTRWAYEVTNNSARDYDDAVEALRQALSAPEERMITDALTYGGGVMVGGEHIPYRDILIAPAESLAALPDGWKLVPIDATDAMVRAMQFRNIDTGKACYRKMLAIAPPAPAREPLDGWISVDQEMPEKDAVVLLAAGRHVAPGWLASAGNKYPFAFIDSDELDSYDGDTVTVNAWIKEKVTHWKPLPPAPKAAK